MSDLQALQNDFQASAALFSALGDKKRQAIIVRLLQEDDACTGLRVGDLTEVTGLSRPAVSHHLKKLRNLGIVTFRREGTRNYYHLAHQIDMLAPLKQLLTSADASIAQRQLS